MSACAGCAAPIGAGDRYCEVCGRAALPAGRFEAEICCGAGISDRGRRYPENQDAFAFDCLDGKLALAVVCDGVSASPRSADAARVAADAGLAALTEAMNGGGIACDAVRDAAFRAGKAVAAIHVFGDAEALSCTFLCAVASSESVTVGWLGDSRAYWLSGTGSWQLSEDDSVPGTHAITRWLGADADDVRPRVAELTLPGPGTLLLCSDGLWNYLPDPQAIAAAVPACALRPMDAAKLLTELALAGGGHDNITAVLIPLPLRHGEPTHDYTPWI